MTNVETNAAPTDLRELNAVELEEVAGGEHSLGDTIHRLIFAVGCVLGGNDLSVHGDQLHCTLK